MQAQNVTIRMEKKLLTEAKMLAASRSQSLSELISVLARKTLAQDAAFRARRKHFRQRLEKGFQLGTEGKLSVSRDELHGR